MSIPKNKYIFIASFLVVVAYLLVNFFITEVSRFFKWVASGQIKKRQKLCMADIEQFQ